MNCDTPDNLLILAKRFEKRYKYHRILFQSINTLIRPFMHSTKFQEIPPPRSILLANAGFLGDVVISTSVLPVLKDSFPGARIGFLTSSKSQVVINNHPYVDCTHVLDHWYLYNKDKFIIKRILLYYKQSKQLIKELKEVNYDIAIDLRMLFPNYVSVYWQAGIPYRIAYNFMGGEPFLSHVLEFNYLRKHESLVQAELLRVLPISEKSFQKKAFNLSAPRKEDKMEVISLFKGEMRKYRILHIGSSKRNLRDWPKEQWIALAQRLVSEGNTLVFTGTGDLENSYICEITHGLTNCLNACDMLSWRGLVELVRGAEIVYCVETSVGHVASAVGTPCVSIYGGIHDPYWWKPFGEHCILATLPLPCSPCHLRRGCEDLICLKELPVELVYLAGEKAILNTFN